MKKGLKVLSLFLCIVLIFSFSSIYAKESKEASNIKFDTNENIVLELRDQFSCTGSMYVLSSGQSLNYNGDVLNLVSYSHSNIPSQREVMISVNGVLQGPYSHGLVNGVFSLPISGENARHRSIST